MKTIPEIFSETTARMGDRTAMRQKRLGIWHEISWNQYREHALWISAALLEYGFEPGECVSIIGDNCPEWLYIDLGIIGAGGVSTGIYTTNSWEQTRYVVDHSESTFLFVENEEQLDKWLRFRNDTPKLKKVIVWDLKGLRDFHDPDVIPFPEFMNTGRENLEKYREKLDQIRENITPEDTAILVYTSGTTGMPKGAELSHRNITWMSKSIIEIDKSFDIGEHDEVLSFLPLCHIFERLLSVFVHMTAGYRVNFIESPDTVADNMREVSPTVGYAVPRIWEKYYSTIYIKMADTKRSKRMMYYLAMYIGQKYAEAVVAHEPIPFGTKILYRLMRLLIFDKLRERLGMDRMKIAFSAAAPIAPDVLKFYYAIGLPMIEAYGQTETTGVTTSIKLSEFRLGTVGKPLDDVVVKLAEDGEIMVKSPGVFKGYFKNPEATEESFHQEWLLSGDIGEFDDDGYLRIVDRKKDLIITAGGKNIAPQYIENKLKFSPYINDAIVIGDQRKFLSALIVLDEDNVVKFARDQKLQFGTYADLTRHKEIQKLINTEVNQVNASLSRVENIRKFSILPKKLYQEDGEVTPTMKVKRNYVNQAYRDTIEAMYQ